MQSVVVPTVFLELLKIKYCTSYKGPKINISVSMNHNNEQRQNLKDFSSISDEVVYTIVVKI